MEFKKIIFILSITITVIVLAAFGVSYGYYSYASANTLLNASTITSLPTVTYAQTNNLNDVVGIPIAEEDYATDASKSQFTITYGSNLSSYDVAVKISLTNIVIDNALKNSYFRYKLERDNTVIASGNFASVSGSLLIKDLEKKTITTYPFVENYTLYIYLVDSGSEQNAVMGKSFSAKISVDTVAIRNG